MPILHERASAWSEGRGFFEGAIRHAIAATDYERAGMLVAHHWFGYVAAGQSATVERWLESLPEELTTHDAPLLLVRAWICALSGRREEAETFLSSSRASLARDRFPTEPPPLKRAWLPYEPSSASAASRIWSKRVGVP